MRKERGEIKKKAWFYFIPCSFDDLARHKSHIAQWLQGPTSIPGRAWVQLPLGDQKILFLGISTRGLFSIIFILTLEKHLNLSLFFCTCSEQTTRCPVCICFFWPFVFKDSNHLFRFTMYIIKKYWLNDQYKPRLVPYLCFVVLEVQNWWIPRILMFCAFYFTETLGTNNYCLNKVLPTLNT